MTDREVVCLERLRKERKKVDDAVTLSKEARQRLVIASALAEEAGAYGLAHGLLIVIKQLDEELR